MCNVIVSKILDTHPSVLCMRHGMLQMVLLDMSNEMLKQDCMPLAKAPGIEQPSLPHSKVRC